MRFILIIRLEFGKESTVTTNCLSSLFTVEEVVEGFLYIEISSVNLGRRTCDPAILEQRPDKLSCRVRRVQLSSSR